MANLSWRYYKGYYQGFTDWDNRKSEVDAVKRRIQDFFTTKNQPFLDFTLPTAHKEPGDVPLATTYPGLLIGSGYTHEVGAIGETKIGFQLDHTTGLPIITGSSIKGAIRAAFPQFEPKPETPWLIKDITAADEISREKAKYIARLCQWKLPETELFAAVHQLEMYVFEGLDIAASIEKQKPVYASPYRRHIFYDALPQKGNGERKLFGTDAITPHTAGPLKNPKPLLFLKVLPKVTYAFRFKVPDATSLHQHLPPNHIQLFTAILCDWGIGAKTNVGYGQLSATK